MIGRTLSHYRVLEKIGEGGMGEVYLAKDTKLDREVAVKVLPAAFSENKERLARFKREAKLLASLNHPNIAAIHGLEESDGVHFLALELVPGETLAERIKRGPIPIDEALPLFKQITEGLEAAHEKGVVHRDLKPANIKVTPEGKVKVLDFGLAKAWEKDSSTQGLSESPTLTKDFTEAGVLLGTAPYMSPEQARGRPVDKRTDIWAFGCCLYEALTGRKAFEGETVTDTIAAVINKEPDWNALPEYLHGRIRELVGRCLRKDSGKRLRDMGDAGLEIEEALTEPVVEPVSVKTLREKPRTIKAVGLLVGGIVLGMALWSLLSSRPASHSGVSHLAISLSPPMQTGGENHSLALSPNGRNLAYVGAGDTSQLYLRSLDQLVSKPILGTEDATAPLFSPDGEWIAFVADGRLKKVTVGGRASIDLCPAPNLRGAVWARDGFIYYSPDILEGLWKVSEAGGTPERVTRPDNTKGEASHRNPELLPDGETLLFYLTKDLGSHFAKLTLSDGVIEELSDQNGRPRYAGTGHLVIVGTGLVSVAPFDARKKRMLAPPVTVLESVQGRSASFAQNFDFSPTGTMVYASEHDFGRSFVMVDRQGNSYPLGLERRPSGFYSLSPDGEKVAVRIDRELWIFDVQRRTLSRFTHQGSTGAPCWSPDGQHLAFMSTAPKAVVNIFSKPLDGSRDAEMILESPYADYPESWSPDGRSILFRRQTQTESGWDLWILPLGGAREPEPYVSSPFNETRSCFSPDGAWVAYQSDESSREEIYISPYPGPGAKVIVSTDGGSFPAWSRDGKELFYRSGNKLMAVPVQLKPEVIVGQPEMLFEGTFYQRPPGVMPDGREFLMIREELLTHVNIVLNWFEELKHLVPTN